MDEALERLLRGDDFGGPDAPGDDPAPDAPASDGPDGGSGEKPV